MNSSDSASDAARGQSRCPSVSAIIVYLNAARFLRETLQSVRAQTLQDWELILVDDGSSDDGPAIARAFAAEHPGRVRCLAHPGGENRGISASRNLGLAAARGTYVAFLDADDLWTADKLARQTEILERHPRAEVVFGPDFFWHSWNAKNAGAESDRLVQPCAPANRLYAPPELLRIILKEHATVPCNCSMTFRRESVVRVGGFEERFRGMYEDQAFLVKLFLHCSAYIDDAAVSLYRQHPHSCCAVAHSQNELAATRRDFVEWVARYFERENVRDRELQRTLRAELFAVRHRRVQHALLRVRALARRGRTLVKSAAWPLIPSSALGLVGTLRGSLPAPPVGSIRWGDLRRYTPFSRAWGMDRGQAVDRFYIESFLAARSADIRGRVLEIGDNTYTARFGRAVTRSDVLHVKEGNPHATFVGDLAEAPQLPSDAFDCVVLTQTLQLIYDLPAALATVHRILRPGGVVLATVPGITATGDPEWEPFWNWNFTRGSARRLFSAPFGETNVQLESFGNVLAATAFLYGAAAGELTADQLAFHDPSYCVTIAIRAQKEASTPAA